MTLLSYQGSYNGLTFGYNTDVQLVQIDGLRALPGIRSGDLPKPRLDGAFPGLNFFDERVLTLTLQVFAPKLAPYETVLENVANAFQSVSNPASLLPLQFQFPGWPAARQVIGRPTQGGYPIDTQYQFQIVTIPIQFTCPDPLIYDVTTQTVSTGLPSPTAGLTFNATPNFVFGASSGGSMQATNSGNYTTPPVFTIHGPVNTPTVTLLSTGQFMTLALTLGSTDSVVIDMGARTVTLNGTASRYNTITTGSTFFGLLPGVNTIGVSSLDATAVSATFTCAWASAWGWI